MQNNNSTDTPIKPLSRAKQWALKNPEKFKEQRRRYEAKRYAQEGVKEARRLYYVEHRDRFLGRSAYTNAARHFRNILLVP